MKGKKSWDIQCSRWVNISQASASMNSADFISNRRRQWQPTLVLLPGKSHEWRSLVGCSPWSLEESDTTERLHFHFSLSCIGEGNGNPLQCSCLENPMDGGAWWAAVYGVAQSRTRLKWLSSSRHSSRHLEKEMATHSSVLAWRIPGTGEPGGLLSMGSQSWTQLKWLSSSSSINNMGKCWWWVDQMNVTWPPGLQILSFTKNINW